MIELVLVGITMHRSILIWLHVFFFILHFKLMSNVVFFLAIGASWVFPCYNLSSFLIMTQGSRFSGWWDSIVVLSLIVVFMFVPPSSLIINWCFFRRGVGDFFLKSWMCLQPSKSVCYCRNMPFCGRARRDSRVRFLKEERCAESPPTFICGKRQKKPKEIGQNETSKFGSCIYVWGRY